MAPLCVRSPLAAPREDAGHGEGFTRCGFPARPALEQNKRSVPLALAGVVGGAGPTLGRPCADGPRGAGRVGRAYAGSPRLALLQRFKDGESSARRKTVAPWFAG